MRKRQIKCTSLTISPMADGTGLLVETTNHEPMAPMDKTECAKFLGVSIRTIENYVNRRRNPLPFTRLGGEGGLLRFDEAEVTKWQKGEK